MVYQIASLDIQLLTKHFSMMSFEYVNIIRSQCKSSRSYDSNLEEEARFLDWELEGFPAKGKGTQGRNH